MLPSSSISILGGVNQAIASAGTAVGLAWLGSFVALLIVYFVPYLYMFAAAARLGGAVPEEGCGFAPAGRPAGRSVRAVRNCDRASSVLCCVSWDG